ncbi:MAG: outer membrane protein assembly factor BamE [Hyphomicrobiales bacterium]|nr:outer membrane protein assembly factor BamE [Hyphomicrobiales bacterium]MCP5373507.1 outer membrane protein assembly factor BamE [Hyphomicrobiales bacterium]
MTKFSAKRSRYRFPATLALCLGLALGAAACAPRIDTRGNLPDPDLLADLKPGEISRNEVEEILGSPSTVAMFEEETWFYVSERTETTAFFAPQVEERQVLILKFNSQGMLSGMRTVGLDASREVDPVDRETPTAGNEMTILDQLLGNLGRFSGDAAAPQK